MAFARSPLWLKLSRVHQNKAAVQSPMCTPRAGLRKKQSSFPKALAMVEAPPVELATVADLGVTDGDVDRYAWEQEDVVENEEMSYAEFEEMLEKYDFNFKPGDKVSGIVLAISNKGAMVDIGAKATAFCPKNELAIKKVQCVDDVLIEGDEKTFVILRDEQVPKTLRRERGEEMTLSLKQIEVEAAWTRMRLLQSEDATLEAHITMANRGGLLCDVESLRGFIPASHVAAAVPREELIDKVLPCKIIEVDEENGRLVLSHRRAATEELGTQVNVGDVLEGVVASVKTYGAFVNVGGLNGLLHISQISAERVTAVENHMAPGDKLKVMVLSFDRQHGRLALSTKKLEPSPGDMLRDPKTVYERADEMAAAFKERVAAAEAAAEEAEAALMKDLA